MSMAPFHTRFRDLAARETRSVTVRGTPGLPDGEYGFIEFYCNDPGCDCRRVVINVVCSTTGPKIWASINFGWESLDFYERWMGDKESAREAQGAMLDPFNQQSPYSQALLELLNQVCLADPAYVERLKRHYDLFKAKLHRQTPLLRRPKARVLRRR
jgi:hypothetical protein